MNTLAGKALSALAAAIAWVIFAPVAHADNDSIYLRCLSNTGIPYDNNDAAIKLGHEIVSDFLSGVPQNTVQSKLMNGVGMTQQDAYQIMACAAFSYPRGEGATH
jgi:hypothetical protein